MRAMADAFWSEPAFATSRPISVLVAQRRAQDKRSFVGIEELAHAGHSSLQGRSLATVWRVVSDLEKRSLMQQAAIFASSDVLIGAVGAALAWLVVMRPGAQVLEWLPKGVPPPLYRCSEAWNADPLGMFGGLGRLAGVDHACLRSEAVTPEVPLRERWSAERAIQKDAYWRTANLEVDKAKFVRWAGEAVARAARSRRLASG